jgi:2-keto-4-pentenoate hydratase/2-oxohepta-3-ene-1,7-dioic acid hydratase in catechol pathway
MTPTTAAQRLDPTLDPALRSWVEAANDASSDFPIQNLPFGVFRRVGSGEPPRIGVAIGDHVLDVLGCIEEDLLTEINPETARGLSGSTLNHLMSQGADAWSAARRALSRLLANATATLRDNAALRERLLVPIDGAELTVPAVIGDYTDFYASVHHAMNVGSMFRPDNPLLPNYKHLPVGYHGRASSIVASGTPVRRPQGQTKADDAAAPTFGPSRLLDYELEMGFLIGPGNEMGRRITMAEARSHIFGMVIVNDWSARDIQKWEYQPLGPFNAKNFAGGDARRPGTVSRAGPAAVRRRPPHIGLSATDRRRRLRHHRRGVRFERTDAAAANGSPACEPRQFPGDVLDDRPDAGAPHVDRLQPEARGPDGQRHRVGTRGRIAWLPAGAHVAGPEPA